MAQVSENRSKVWFYPIDDPADVEAAASAIRALWSASGAGRRISPEDLVAIKIHVGELNNSTHLKPGHVAPVVSLVRQSGGQAFLAETSTIYKGERDNAIRHALHAHRHGFGVEATGAPFISLDGLAGNSEVEVAIPGEIHRSVLVARDVAITDALVVVSHPTGHLVSGIGAAIKNLGMGLASRTGKLRQHSSVTPRTKGNSCTGCNKCVKWCPEDAIVPMENERRIHISLEKCVGCGECISVCRFGAISFDWDQESSHLQRAMAEHAMGALAGKEDKVVFISVLVDMTPECDCMGMEQHKAVPDRGVLLSFDPVAIDCATIDLAVDASGADLSRLSHPALDPGHQLVHAQKIGMGNMKYELIEIS